jgi:nitroreductase
MPAARNLDRATVDHLLSTTRAVRRRLDLTKPVERELILECIALAQQTPTAGNGQTWHWVVVTDAAKRAAIARIYQEVGEMYLRPVAAAGFKDRQTERVYDSAFYLLDVLAEVPVFAIPCAGPVASDDPLGNFMGASFYGSVFPAVWSYQLAARSRGLGTVLTTLHLAREAEVAEILEIPSNQRQIALIPTAYYTGDDFQPAARPPAASITSWDRWGG